MADLPKAPTHSAASAAMTARTAGWLLLCICVLGLAVRLWGIDYGLPHEGMTYNQVTFEESKEVHRAFKLGIGEYDRTFGKGGMFWILFFEFGVYYALSLAFGWVSDSREFAMRVLEDRTTAFMIGRVTVAFMGVLTLAVIYAVGRRLYDQRTGLIAALIGALAYHHVQTSTVINVDIGMLLFLWASVLCYVIYEQGGRLRWLVGAGALAGVAVAFKLPGVVVVPFILVALITIPRRDYRPRLLFKEGLAFFAAAAVALTITAPEWIPWFIGRASNAFASIGGSLAYAAEDPGLDDQIWDLTQGRSGFTTGYFSILLREYNLVLTLAALAGFGLGLLRRQRWTVLLGLFAIGYVLFVSFYPRSPSERYIMPIVPVLWLLGASTVAQLSVRYKLLLPVGLAVLLAMPSVHLARAAVERSNLDTRLVAKEWIEANLPDGSRILMDGMQHRFIPSPPLLPNEVAIERQLGRVARQVEEGRNIGRGVNEQTLGLYRKSFEEIAGPRYDLHSTVQGLVLRGPSNYVDECFDYVVTSSSIAGRYRPGGRGREMNPEAAYFYEQLDVDPRFTKVFEVGPRDWERSGPTITVYRISHGCD
jgi:4-amino-4-deoxy-L-arabinose transferase-like glycosyltransferase